MTHDELKIYSELQEKFSKDVLHVVSYLKEIDEDFRYVDSFYLRDDGMVETHGTMYDGRYQYSEEHYGSFDLEMLAWTDDELKKYVDKIKAGKEAERVRKEIEDARRKKDEERSLWEKLNEKFGKK